MGIKPCGCVRITPWVCVDHAVWVLRLRRVGVGITPCGCGDYAMRMSVWVWGSRYVGVDVESRCVSVR